VLSLGIHEAAHGWMALKCGDTTARDLGRITLNPFAHIDPFMTILLPIVFYVSTGFVFGGAKPVPVNFYNLKKPHRDMALVAIAGPASNFLLAIFFFLCWKLLVQELGIWEGGSLGSKVLENAVFFNLLLAAFNLMPIPPLDGSRIMTWLLPDNMRGPYVRLESIGLLLVFFAIYMVPQVRIVLFETIEVMYVGVQGIVTLGGVW
jgi:Zn-dependent protease